jgi:hypothetical protein
MTENSPAGYGDLIYSIIIVLFLFEFAIGIIQLLGALIRTIIRINTKQPIGKLKTYWIVVGVYFLIHFGLNMAQYLIIRLVGLETLSSSNDYHDRFNLSAYLIFAQIVWIFLAWGIAIWYCIQIVFLKQKKTIEINHSLIQ